MKDRWKLSDPEVVMEYFSMPREDQRKYDDLVCGILDINPREDSYSKMLLVAVDRDETAYFIKEEDEKYWIDLGQLSEIPFSWRACVEETFQEFKKHVDEIKKVRKANIIAVYAAVSEGVWIYAFSDPTITGINETFYNKYLGDVLGKEETRKLISELYGGAEGDEVSDELCEIPTLQEQQDCAQLFAGMNDAGNLTEAFAVYCDGIKAVFSNIQIPQAAMLSETVFHQMEDQLTFSLPEEVKIWFSMVGDCRFGIEGPLVGLELLSAEEMLEIWKEWRVLDDDAELNRSPFASSTPKGAVRCRYTNPCWIPVAHDYASNYIGIDLDPDVQGVVGQVINFGKDEDAKVVFAESLLDFLKCLIRRQNEMCVVKMRDHYIYINRDDEHPIDWLKKAL